MKPFPLGPDLPTSVTSFDIHWSAWVTEVTALTEANHPYLAAIAQYSNHDGVHGPGGIFALALDLAIDAEADRLLSVVHHMSWLQSGLAASMFGRTAAATALREFGSEADGFTARIEAARFEYLSPFLLEGTLAEDLFCYGMYKYFYQDHSANEARALARRFLADTVGDELESMIPLTTRSAWGDWFDPHSCSDRSWLLIERRARRAWLLAASHSD